MSAIGTETNNSSIKLTIIRPDTVGTGAWVIIANRKRVKCAETGIWKRAKIEAGTGPARRSAIILQRLRTRTKRAIGRARGRENGIDRI